MPIPPFVLELRRHVGTAPLWLIGATAVVLRDGERGPEVLLVQRAESGDWSPVSGIVDPGEEPHVTAVREVQEEARVQAVVDRLAWISASELVTYDNGDQARYLDHTFACRWVAGEPEVGDDESSDARFWPLAALPPLRRVYADRLASVLAGDRTPFLGADALPPHALGDPV